MKTNAKIWLGAAAAAVLPVILNRCIVDQVERSAVKRPGDQYYKWRHGNIRYTCRGAGEPLLLVHNAVFGGGMHEWSENISALSRRFKVYTLDLLGFGRSDKPAISYSSYLFTSLLNDFVRNVITVPTHVIASGHGANYAVMAQFFRPDLYKSMILVSPAGLGTHRAVTNDSQFICQLMESPWLGTTAYNVITSKLYFRWYLKNFIYGDPDAVTEKIVNRYYFSAHYGGENAKYMAGALIAGYLNVNIEHKLKALTLPVHVVWGEDNVLDSISNFHTISNQNPNIGLTVFEGAKCLPHAEQPANFGKVCRRFYDTLPRN